MTPQDLAEINLALQREGARMEALTEITEMLNRLVQLHFLDQPPVSPDEVMGRTSHLLNGALQEIKEMTRISHVRAQAMALAAMEPPTNGDAHA